MADTKLIKNNAIYLANVVAGGFLGYLFQFTVARNLSLKEYGEFQAVVSVMMIFGVFFSVFSYFIIKNSSVFYSHNDRIGQVRFLDYVRKKLNLPIFLFTLVFFLFFPLIKNFLHLGDYAGLFFIGASMLIFFYSGLYSNAIQGWSAFLAISLVGTGVALVKFASGYFLAMFFKTASASAGSFLAAGIFSWFLFWLYFKNKWPRGEEAVENGWREKYFEGISFKKSVVWILFFSLGLSAVSNLDMVLVKSFSSPEIAGYFGAMSVLGKIILWLNLAIIGVIFPEACSIWYKKCHLSKKAIGHSYLFMALISFFIISLYYFSPHFFVKIIFGEQYIFFLENLWLFGASAFFLSLLTFEATLALAREDFKSVYLLFASAGFLTILIYVFGSNIRSIIISAIVAFFAGWLALLILDLKKTKK